LTLACCARNPRRGFAGTWAQVEVNEGVNVDVAVNLKVGVDVEVYDSAATAQGALFYTS